MVKKFVIGFDVGGTTIRGAISDYNGNFIARIEEKLDKKSENAVSNQIIKLTYSLCHLSNTDIINLKSIGIASAGPIDLNKGALIKPTNLPFKYVPLTEPISREFRIPVFLLNDCTAGVLGEKEFGAGRDLNNIFFLALGTGIGGGAIVDGHLLFGKDGNAVEIGHITIDYEERLKCGCGKRGHWEAYCSGRNMPNFVRMKLENTKKEEVENSLLFEYTNSDSRLGSEFLFNAANNGDQLAIDIVKEIGKLNAIGFANIINAYDPSLITVGGSVALNNKKLVLKPIKQRIQDFTRNRIPRIASTPLAQDAGLYGAIAAALYPRKWFVFNNTC
jgi:glucokinase